MKLNAQSYDKIATTWNEVRSPRTVDSCIVDFCNLLPKGARVLDVGCGTGKPIGTYCLERGFSLVGIDVSNGMLSLAKENLPNTTLVHSDLIDFFDEERFDGVIGFDSLWHIPLDRQRKIYEKVSSLLRDGGLFIFTAGLAEGTVRGEMFGEQFEYASLDSAEVLALLSKNGFEVVRDEKHYSHPTSGTRDWLVIARKVK